jgi:methionyl-tRNA synthetase
MTTPFLPFSAQRLHELLGYDDVIAGPLAFETVSEDGVDHVVLTGDYASWGGGWAPSALPAGQSLREPAPLFAKLDSEQVVADELARMEAAASR